MPSKPKDSKAKDKVYFRVTFTNEQSDSNELFQVCARNVATSELYGLIELSDFIFPDSRIVYNPGEERIRREFENVRRTWIPYHAIVRIDEVPDGAVSEVKVVSLETARAPDSRRLVKNPD